MFEMHYTGGNCYPKFNEITAEAKKRGCKYAYWASDDVYGYTALYNGDTVIVYDDIESVPESYQEDARKYGELIKE